MSGFAAVQLLVDVVLLFLILVLLAGRPWRRGRGAPEGEQEAYRDMVTTLSQLIAQMKDELGVLQDRLDAKQAEVRGLLAAVDERLERLRAAPAVPVAPPSAPIAPPIATTAPVRPADPEPDDAEDRRERYRQALEFSEKGWNALDIARATRLPRGEVELLIRTKGRKG